MTEPTPGPWHWENGEYDCDGYCSPYGCSGHDNGIPEYLVPVGLWTSEPPSDWAQWNADARLIAAAPLLLEALEEIKQLLEQERSYFSVSARMVADVAIRAAREADDE